MARIFISYARADRAVVEHIAEALETEGHAVWFDRDIRVGEEYANRIEQEINSADIVIPVWSETSAQSNWVKDEATRGHAQRKLVPVTLSANAIPIGFGQLHTVSLEHFDGRLDHPTLLQLLRDIDATVARVRPSASSPPAADIAGVIIQVATVGVAIALVTGMLLTALHWLNADSTTMPMLVVSMHQLAFVIIPGLLTSALCSWRLRRAGLKSTRALVGAVVKCLRDGTIITLVVLIGAALSRSPNIPTGLGGLPPAGILAVSSTIWLAVLVAFLRLVFAVRRK